MQVIIFDVGNVIIKATHEITMRILGEYGVPEQRRGKFFDNPDYDVYSRGMMTSREFYNRLVETHLKFPLKYEQIVRAHDEHMYAVDSGVAGILEKLWGSGRELAFLTDTNEWQTRREKEMVNLAKYSEKIFRSHETHFLKTDEGCFEHVIKELGGDPASLLLVDDSPEKIEMARKHGLQTIQFLSAEQLASSKLEKAFKT